MNTLIKLVLLATLLLALASCENMKRGIYEASQQVEKGKIEDAGIPADPPPAPDYREYKEYREKK